MKKYAREFFVFYYFINSVTIRWMRGKKVAGEKAWRAINYTRIFLFLLSFRLEYYQVSIKGHFSW